MAESLEIRRLMNEAVVELPGATETTIKLKLFSAARQFLDESNVWQEGIDLQVRAGVQTYDVLPYQGTIARLLDVRTPQEDTHIPATMEVLGAPGQPGELVLRDVPSADDDVVVQVALTVVDPETGAGFPDMPDWIVVRHYPTLLHGTLAGMMAMPAKPWSNTALATYHAGRFRSGISRARTEARAKNVYAGQRWSFPHFA